MLALLEEAQVETVVDQLPQLQRKLQLQPHQLRQSTMDPQRTAADRRTRRRRQRFRSLVVPPCGSYAPQQRPPPLPTTRR